MHTPEDSTRQLIPSRAELAWPENDWSRTGDWQDIRVSGQRYQLFCGDSSIISYQLKKEQVGLSETPYLNANSAMIRLLKTNLMLSFIVPTTAMQAQPSSTASPPSCQTSPTGRSSSWTSTLMQLMSFQLCG